MLHAISKAIFGDPNEIELRVITAAQRLPSLQDGSVDIVARNMTINCARWKEIAFSSEYYRSGQKVLVRRERSKADHRWPTWPARRSAPPTARPAWTKLTKLHPRPTPVGADTHTGCLVLFQQGKVDAITGDDTVLAGLAAQDPYAVVRSAAFTAEPYGLGVNSQRRLRPVRQRRARRDARATASGRRTTTAGCAEALGPAPAPPEAVYGRAP